MRTGIGADRFWPILRRFHAPSRAVMVSTGSLAAELAGHGIAHTRYNELLEAYEGQAGMAGRLLEVAVDGTWCRAGFADDSSVRIPVLTESDPEGATARQYGVAGRQAVFVIGPEGTVRWRFVAPPGVYPRPETVQQALIDRVAASGSSCKGRTRCGLFICWTIPTASDDRQRNSHERRSRDPRHR